MDTDHSLGLPANLLAFPHIADVELGDAAPYFLYELVYLLVWLFVMPVFLTPVILPVYVLYLVRINRRRRENGASNILAHNVPYHFYCPNCNRLPPILGMG